MPVGFGGSSASKRKTGLVAGLGLDYAIAHHVAVGAEYLYTTYGSIKLPINVGTFTFRPNVNTFNFRVKYTF